MTDSIFLILGSIGGVAAVVMTLVSAINYHKPRRISALSSLLAGLIAALGLAALILLGGMAIKLALGLPLLMLGLLFGYFRGQAVKLNWQNEIVIGRNSPLFLIIWGLSLALSQFLGLLGSPLLASLGLIPAVFSTGLQLGYHGNLFLRRIFMRPNRNGRTMNTIVGIGGSIALVLLTLISLLLTIPELILTYPTGVASAQAPSSDSAFEPATAGEDSQESEPGADTTSPGTDQETGGPLRINCADQIERIKEHSVNAYNLSGANASFEQAFTDYQINLEMNLDLESREFILDYRRIESWSWYGFDREYYETKPGPLSIFQLEYLGDGTLLDNGWISGDFTHYYTTWDDQDNPKTEQDSNLFLGFIDDTQETVSICLLPVGANRKPENETLDLDEVIAAGKNQLVPDWWNVNSCYICAID